MKPMSSQDSKLLKTGSRSAKHIKSRHKGRNHNKVPKGDATHTERTNSEEVVEVEDQEAGDEDGMSMCELARLRRFGDLCWLVKAVSVHIKQDPSTQGEPVH
jgi:hypothetical protein